MAKHFSKTHTAPKKAAPKLQKDPARLAVFNILKAILQTGQTLDSAFEAQKAALSARDLAFAYTLAAGVLRTALFLDTVSAKHLKKPFAPEADENIVLRMGIYQLLFMDGVKDHAAIATTVDLIKALKQPHLSGVMNAVLRQIQRSETPSFVAESCLPAWFAQKLKPNFDLATLAPAMLQQALVDVRVYAGNAPENGEALAGLKNAFRLPENTHASALEGLNTGGLYVQDMAAQWPATILANALDAKKLDGPVVDMCAAPGGKTLQLLDLLKNHIIAADLNPRRLKKLHQNAAHMPRQPEIVVNDGLNPTFEKGSLAGLLLDAPCTATGTTRRHPEVLHLRKPADLEHLADLQRKMLAASAELLQQGGVLVYAVCSLFHKEGEAQDTWALNNLPLKPLAFTVPESLNHAHTSPHTLRFTPADLEHAADGFFIACYEKQ